MRELTYTGRGVALRVGELFLKGKNRFLFEKALEQNLRRSLAGRSDVELVPSHGRLFVLGADDEDVIARLSGVFGVASLSPVLFCEKKLSAIQACAVELAKDHPGVKTFRISARRADKTFALTSVELNREVGGRCSWRPAGASIWRSQTSTSESRSGPTAPSCGAATCGAPLSPTTIGFLACVLYDSSAHRCSWFGPRNSYWQIAQQKERMINFGSRHDPIFFSESVCNTDFHCGAAFVAPGSPALSSTAFTTRATPPCASLRSSNMNTARPFGPRLTGRVPKYLMFLS